MGGNIDAAQEGSGGLLRTHFATPRLRSPVARKLIQSERRGLYRLVPPEEA